MGFPNAARCMGVDQRPLFFCMVFGGAETWPGSVLTMKIGAKKLDRFFREDGCVIDV